MLVQFVADTLFKTLVAVPVVGGLVLVALVVGGNPFDLLRLDDLTQTISTMVGVLLAQPVALAAFVGALGIILAGGSILMFAVKAGTRDGAAGRRSRGRRDRSAAAPDVGACARPTRPRSNDSRTACGRCSSATCGSGIVLTVVYAIIAGAYIAFVFGPSIARRSTTRCWSTLASLSVLVAITLVNFLYLLMQIVMAAENCGVLDAIPHVARLLRRRAKELGQVLAAILALMLMATGASILATTQLGLIGFVPFVGLAALPLQVFAWLVRGVVFQFVGLTGVATYLRMHFALQSAPVEVQHAVATACSR